jgi:acetyl-CoA carboxylase biotin carboxyl carrier protein
MAEPNPSEVAEAARRRAAQLMEQRGDAPRSVRVRATEISVEFDWGAGTSAPAAPAPAARREAAPATAAPGGPVPSDGAAYLCSPSVGTFYRSPEPSAPPFVDVGAVVAPGQQIGIVEVMKLMIPVEAETGGRIVEVLKADAEPVEYGEKLFTVVADGAGG